MKFETDCECPSCNGTGLYQGMGEMDGVAIECRNCKGTGKFHFVYTYEPFTKRRHPNGIDRVHKCNPGICIDADPKFGGMPFKDWSEGKPFPPKSENRKYTCPRWWYQCGGGKEFKSEKCFGTLGRTFSECKHFKDKAKCWEEYDKETK